MNLKSSLLNQSIQNKLEESPLEGSDSLLAQQFNSDLLISVVIPVYNEENSIKDVIKRIPNHHNYEIIIVDGGSTDNSINNIRKIKNKDLKIIQQEKKQGYGAAILRGLMYARGDVIVTIDSDGQHSPEEISMLIEPLIKEDADLVIGSRYLGSSSYKIPLHTRFGELVVKLCLKYLYGQNVGNNQSGFRAFKRELLKLFIEIENNGMAFTTEFLFKAMEAEKKILEIPITLNSRSYGTSYVNLFKIIISILLVIIKYSITRFKITQLVFKKIIPYLKFFTK